ncbi:hypothetical protein [Bradyrhizobium sp. sBnM-33]|uniref:hypothetical protein n=1 Tax=Bradyrhizobium sp. sBnM-33 TaxID=2831780 RepID=UPI001BD11AA6|nr:hypothetical protein [Bradyrhizobium sp. sBnM-33]WOH53825.1 hypothetical protein RX328_18075 [Bradyrhizobium sp. sBnM-33]
MKICTVCPHQNDCLNTGACLDELNAPQIAANQFPERMTPDQANDFMAALRDGRTLRRICGGGRLGPPIASASKFRKHCSLYPEWGAGAERLATENRKASEKLKGLGASRSGETHCRNGHPYAVFGSFKAKDRPEVRPYEGSAISLLQSLQCGLGQKTYPAVAAINNRELKDLLRHGKAPHSFTTWGAPNRLCKFYAFKQLCENDSEVNNLAALSLERRKLLRSPSTIITIPKPAIIKASNLRAPTLTGRVAGRADVVFSAVNEAVSSTRKKIAGSHWMPRHSVTVPAGRGSIGFRKRMGCGRERLRSRPRLGAPRRPQTFLQIRSSMSVALAIRT